MLNLVPLLLFALQEPAPAAPQPRTVELALCLDTSGSMDGLIEAAKSKLWAVVNDLALAQPAPRLRVALLSYGNDGHDAAAGWVRVAVPLTGDLDLVSRELFALTTNGGTELVGRVLRAALEQLDWDRSADALRLLVVAGNESADQDAECPFRDLCKRAAEAGTLVDALYCGAAGDGDAAGWEELARLADGHYASIDTSGAVAAATPFDEQLAALSTSLNATYVPYSAAGAAGWANQAAQDANAAALHPGVAAERAQCKSGALYNCDWDLVDACRSGALKIEEVKTADLPESLRGLSREQLEAHLALQWQQRVQIQEQIRSLSGQRDGWLQELRAHSALDPAQVFDAALRAAVRAQAAAKGLAFPPEPAPAATMSQP